MSHQDANGDHSHRADHSDISKACVGAGNVEGELSLAEYLGIGGRSGYEINSSIVEAGKKAKEKMASRCSIIVTL